MKKPLLAALLLLPLLNLNAAAPPSTPNLSKKGAAGQSKDVEEALKECGVSVAKRLYLFRSLSKVSDKSLAFHLLFIMIVPS